MESGFYTGKVMERQTGKTEIKKVEERKPTTDRREQMGWNERKTQRR